MLRYLLESHAAARPEQTFVRLTNGDEWSFGRMRDEARRVATGLHALGVRQGDHVLSFLPNSIDAARIWYGLNYLGAVYIPVNPAYRGSTLEHVIATSGASLIVAHAGLAPRLADVDRSVLTDVLTIHGGCADIPGLRSHDEALLAGPADDAALELERPIEPWDTQGIWYTSGTTGPAKGVLSSYMHAYHMFGPETMPMFGADDRYMINLPLFHMGGTGLWNSMLIRGGSVAFVEQFKTQTFWRTVKETGTTIVFMLGVMASFLESQPPSEEERGHGLRIVFVIPVPDDVPAFAERFGIEVYSIYNMTEICTPIITGPTPTVPGTCGRLRPGVQVRLVDENDCEVPVGEVGEFIVRTDTPWGMNHGYYKLPEATAAAWRNGWFHTGDAGRLDADGNYFFVDRIKDVIRRRGEFVSSLVLETELCTHPGIAAAAVVGVPSEYAEEEILAIVIPANGVTEIDFAGVIDYLRPRVPHFMIPRYFRTAAEVPMTPTGKVRKNLLRSEGLAAGTWDREAHGIVVKAERIG